MYAEITSPADMTESVGRGEGAKARIKGLDSVPGSAVARGVCVGARVGSGVGVAFAERICIGKEHPNDKSERIMSIFFMVLGVIII